MGGGKRHQRRAYEISVGASSGAINENKMAGEHDMAASAVTAADIKKKWQR